MAVERTRYYAHRAEIVGPVIMKVPLNIPNGQRQRDFFDYLNSALRERMPNFRGEAGRDESGNFVSTIFGTFRTDQESVNLSWRITKDTSGTLTYIEVEPLDEAIPEARWNTAAYEFITSVLATALADSRRTFFRRNLFFYFGPQLDGEYWLPGFRFAPIIPDDPMPHLINGERVTAIDQVVEAIDDLHASALANEAARRHATRLSILLNVGLAGPDHAMRWVLPEAEDGTLKESIRCHTGYYHPSANISVMPKKGESCPAGSYAGSLAARYRVAGELQSLPLQARKILRGIDQADPAVTDAFDRGSRLYHVALVCGRTFPSVGLAYRVAAVEAISKAVPDFNSFAKFTRHHVNSQDAIEPVLDYLYGKARSGHFHEGEFPLGEYTTQWHGGGLMDSDSIELDALHRVCYDVTREAIVNWILGFVPDISEDE